MKNINNDNNNRTIQYLETILYTKNISKAAEMLYISQPYLTKFTKNIEEELNTIILDRRTFTLTENGKLFFEYIKHVENKRDELLSKVSATKKIKIGILSTLSTYLLPLFLPQFLNEYTDCKIEIITDTLQNNERRLINREIDFLLGQDYETLSPTLSIQHYGNEKYFAIIPNRSKFYRADRTHLKFDELLFENLLKEELILTKKGSTIRRKMDFLLNKKNITPKIVFECDNIFTIFQLSKRNLGITFVPDNILSMYQNSFHEYNVVPLDFDFLRTNYFIAYRNDYTLDMYEKKLASYFIENLKISLDK